MGEPKAFASLSSGLLARKGAARPAMRPQGFAQFGVSPEDLGWNDMGFEPPRPALAAVRDAEHDAFGDAVPEPAIRHPLAGLTPSGPSAPIDPSSPVHGQLAELAVRLSNDHPEPGQPDEQDAIIEPLDVVPATSTLVAKSVASAAGVAPVAQPAPPRAPTVRAAPGGKAKSAFTLRLDRERHYKLRLACAVTGRSAQLLVIDAVDQLLGSMPELDVMAGIAPGLRKVS